MQKGAEVGGGRDVVWIKVAFCSFCEDEELQTHKKEGCDLK